MTPRPAITRPVPPLTGRESYATSLARGIVHYTAPCAVCHRLAEYQAGPQLGLTVWCPTCEAKA